ncbi:hypothetical protein Lal_00041334 [Lupinus albus]|nr:hypothetical protein Lal_00041334 [Lupinus albus]
MTPRNEARPRIFRHDRGDERRRRHRDLREGPVRHRPARRDDAGDGRVRGLPPPQEQPRHRSYPGGDGHGPGSALRPAEGPGCGRRRLPDQARRRHRPVHPRAQPRAPEGSDRRAAPAGARLPRHRNGRPPGHRRRRDRPRRAYLAGEDRPGATERMAMALSQHHRVTVEADPLLAIQVAAEGDFDLALVSLDLQNHDGLRLCSQFRSLDRTRGMPLIMVAEAHDRARIVRGLDFGVHDYLMRPVDRNELLARARTQVRRKRYSDVLRGAMQASLQMAVTDGLTGLHNRRYLDNHLGVLFSDEASRHRPLAALILDIDRFKAINDTYGHEAGDEVLRAFADRVRQHTRPIDIVSRYGGEEIVVILPDAGLGEAHAIAERIRERVEAAPFAVQRDTRSLSVTVSIGVATRCADDASPSDMLRRADEGLYEAKAGGRNRVVAQAA